MRTPDTVSRSKVLRGPFRAASATLSASLRGAAQSRIARPLHVPVAAAGTFLLALGATLGLLALMGEVPILFWGISVPALLLGVVAVVGGGRLGQAFSSSRTVQAAFSRDRPDLASPDPARPRDARPTVPVGQPIVWAALAAGATVGLAPLFRGAPVGPAIGFGVLAVATALLVLRAGRGDHGLRLLLLGALGLRAFLLLADASLGVFAKVDSDTYHMEAALLASAWWHGEAWTRDLSDNVAAYVHFVAPLYLFFGSNVLLPRLASVLLGVATVHNVYRIGSGFLTKHAAYAGAALVALLPSLAQLQTENLRDPLIVWLITLTVRLLLSRRLSRPAAFTGALTSLYGIYLLREPTAFVMAPAVVYLFAGRVRGTARPRARALAAAVTLLLAAATFVVYLGLVGTEWIEPSTIGRIRENWAEGGSAYLANVRFDSWWDVLAFAPVGAAYFLLSPFPWQVHNPMAFLAAWENVLVLYPAAALAAASAWRLRHRSDCQALLLFVGVGVLLYGLIEGNIGTAIRHRAQFTWVVLLLAGPLLASVLSAHAAGHARVRTLPSPETLEEDHARRSADRRASL